MLSASRKTDEDVYRLIGQYDGDVIRRALKGIYDCNRAMGKTVLAALERTLKAYVGEE